MVLMKIILVLKKKESRVKHWLVLVSNNLSMENFISIQEMITETRTCASSCKRKLTCIQIINSVQVCIATTSTVIPWINTTKFLTSKQHSKEKLKSQLTKSTSGKKMKSINILKLISNQKVFLLEVLQHYQQSNENLQIGKYSYILETNQ